MYPILLEWGSIVLPAWHTFYVLGAIAAYLLLIQLARRQTPAVSETSLATMYAVCYVAGYFGARLLSIFIDEPEIKGIGAILMALLRFGPMTFYGGAIASFVAGVIYVRSQKLPLLDLMDLGIPAGLLALAVGRIGCFLNGDDFGKAVQLAAGETPPWWAVTFPNLQDNIARYPIQLIETALVGGLVLVLVLGFKKIRQVFRPGAVGYFGIIGYANLRFFNEFWRGDMRGFVGDTLSTSQFISLLILVVAALSLPFWLRTPGTETE